MNDYEPYYSAVDEIYDCLRRDLVGPVEESEVLEHIEPLSTYACGILWPMRIDSSQSETEESEEVLLSARQDDAEEVEDAVVVSNDSIRNANIHKPTSMGVSVMLPESVSRLSITFSFAKYSHEESKEPVTKKALPGGEDQNEDITQDGEATEQERTIHKYKRTHYSIPTDAQIGERLVTQRLVIDKELGFELTLTLRSVLDDGSKLITLTAQNIARAKQKGMDQSVGALFQCELSISSTSKLLPIYQNNALVNDIEEKITNLQYREVKNYAYGHGCSISYTETPEGVFTVKSDFLPRELVYQMMPGEIKSRNILNLAYWETALRDDACGELSRFVDEYEEWRGSLNRIKDSLDSVDYRQASDTVIERINECVSRLRQGIAVLKSNDSAWKAFVLMNRAMLLQRIKTKKQVDKKTVNWYPFQIAYILQIIPDVVDEKSEYRKSVDLLWFPTGGGKTEAYLGVAAFVIFHRRLTGKAISDDGVTVIMRYTLRLLTIQQFERATALICACEHIRKEKKISGGEISIGLWIGSNMTPNKIKDAEDILKRLEKFEEIYEGNPVQITKCPWCGKEIGLNGYEIKNGKMKIRCADNATCEFHNGLPIYVVDEDIYSVRPTLLLSTIDKFARIAWEENTRNLFGDDTRLPPELIIQDELHLISGPLGSLSGIYEIALDYLCKASGKLPKIIASTATVKNAKEQIRNLYNRQTVQFPPAGIDYDDSFFAVKADADKRPARTYIGLSEMGGSNADLLIRIYATLFFTKAMFIKQGKDPEIIDQYFTTVGYFNALKNLGAASTIIQDRISTHIRNLIARTFKKESERYQIVWKDVKTYEHSELTSRKSSKEIKKTLDRLAHKYNEPECYSYVLASNMLSVGIDIDRLGVMTVYNQPKSNAEYIQATSRVGRSKPGIVMVMYNNMRSRDKSHYEQFGYYHKSFYRYVEATSVTPFSLSAMEKALHCVFVALIRLTIPELSQNDSARRFEAGRDDVAKIRGYIVGRVEEIMPRRKDLADFAEEMLKDFEQDWEAVASDNSNTLCYKSYTGNPSLLSSAEDDSEFGLPKILNSLRNVEPSVNVYFRR